MSARACTLVFHERMRPRPRMTVSEWADAYRIIPPGTSSEPGAWRTDRVPYLKEILDAISDPEIGHVCIRAASQIGKTEILLNTIGYYAHQDPSPILIVQANEEAMRGFSKERIAPMFAASPVLRGLLDSSERSASNTIMLRQFPGGMLACAGAGSAASLASRAIRVVLADELDRWPATTGNEGDPFMQAVQRTTNYPDSKIIAVSSPNLESTSKISRLYEDSDQREYEVPCPRCDTYQPLVWSGVNYKRDGAIDLDDIHYVCAHCAGRIEEREKQDMIAAGAWAARNPGHEKRGYWISAVYSPWRTWRQLAVQWIAACEDRDAHGKQEFKNLRLGEPWREWVARISVESLEKNREDYAGVPDGALLLTAGVDTQDNRLEVEVVGWNGGRESWGIEYAVIAGDTSLPETWERLDEFLQRKWLRPDGRPLSLACVFVDSGGHRTTEVYRFCAPRQFRNVYASKGRPGAGTPLVGKSSTSNQLRINLFPVGADAGKEAVFSRLALPTPGPGYCHFPFAGGYDDEFFKGLISEEPRTTKKRDGHTVRMWTKTRPRNEPLDIRVLATAAMECMTVNWDELAAEELRTRGGGPGAPVVPLRRRVLHRGVE